MTCVSAPSMSTCRPCLLCKSVGGSLQIPRIRRSILRSQQKIERSDDCKRTIASRRSGRVRPTNLVSKSVSDGVIVWKTQGQFDTLAWAIGMHVGAGDHVIALSYIEYGCVLGFCTLIHLHYILRLNCAH